MDSNSPKTPSDVPVAAIEHDMSPLESFVDDNRKRLLWVAVAIVVVICAVIVFKFRARQAEAEAHGAFTGAETVEELRSVLSTYSGDVVTGSAQLLLADKLWEEDKKEESLQTLQSFVDTHKDHPLYFKAVSDLGAHEHIRGNLEKAVALQEEASSAEAPLFVQQLALLRLGDAHTARALAAQEAGDAEAAEKAFEQARVAYEDLESRAGEGMQRVAAVRKQRLPILRVPAEPPAPPAVPAESANGSGATALPAEPSTPDAGTPEDPVVPEDDAEVEAEIPEPPVEAVPQPPDQDDASEPAPAEDETPESEAGAEGEADEGNGN